MVHKKDQKVITFGKHKGLSFSQVCLEDSKYCEWVKSQDSPGGALREFQTYLRDTETHGSAAPVANDGGEGRRRPNVSKASKKQKSPTFGNMNAMAAPMHADQFTNELQYTGAGWAASSSASIDGTVCANENANPNFGSRLSPPRNDNWLNAFGQSATPSFSSNQPAPQRLQALQTGSQQILKPLSPNGLSKFQQWSQEQQSGAGGTLAAEASPVKAPDNNGPTPPPSRYPGQPIYSGSAPIQPLDDGGPSISSKTQCRQSIYSDGASSLPASCSGSLGQATSASGLASLAQFGAQSSGQAHPREQPGPKTFGAMQSGIAAQQPSNNCGNSTTYSGGGGNYFGNTTTRPMGGGTNVGASSNGQRNSTYIAMASDGTGIKSSSFNSTFSNGIDVQSSNVTNGYGNSSQPPNLRFGGSNSGMDSAQTSTYTDATFPRFNAAGSTNLPHHTNHMVAGNEQHVPKSQNQHHSLSGQQHIQQNDYIHQNQHQNQFRDNKQQNQASQQRLQHHHQLQQSQQHNNQFFQDQQPNPQCPRNPQKHIQFTQNQQPNNQLPRNQEPNNQFAQNQQQNNQFPHNQQLNNHFVMNQQENPQFPTNQQQNLQFPQGQQQIPQVSQNTQQNHQLQQNWEQHHQFSQQHEQQNHQFLSQQPNHQFQQQWYDANATPAARAVVSFEKFSFKPHNSNAQNNGSASFAKPHTHIHPSCQSSLQSVPSHVYQSTTMPSHACPSQQSQMPVCVPSQPAAHMQSVPRQQDYRDCKINVEPFDDDVFRVSCAKQMPLDICQKLAGLPNARKHNQSWMFPASDYQAVVNFLRVNPDFVVDVEEPPVWVLQCIPCYRNQVPPLPKKCAILDKDGDKEPGMHAFDQTLATKRSYGKDKALMPYQIEAVKFGIRNGGRVLIGDEMGLGKTVEALTLASCYMEEWPCLIIVPSSVRYAWLEEALEWLNIIQEEITVVIYRGSKRMSELNVMLKSTIMIRRLKNEVLTQLPKKRRQKVKLEVQSTVMKELKAMMAQSGIRDDTTDLDLMCMPESNGNITALFQATTHAKLPAVRDYVEYLVNVGCKFLVFAHHHFCIDDIETKVKEMQVDYIRIDGRVSAERRDVLVRKFNEGGASVPVAILSITACGQGLNLQSCSTVVFAELYWVPGQMIQAEDRVHRLGQQANSVNIHYLVVEDSVDSIMYNTLCRKHRDLSAMLDGKEKSLAAANVSSMGTVEVDSGGRTETARTALTTCSRKEVLSGAYAETARTAQPGRGRKKAAVVDEEPDPKQPRIDTFFKRIDKDSIAADQFDSMNIF
eukprot:GEMP01002756.1.p1 GENE.GEMP01002756.1~~GEMP01002756.1.p1  ORF type:complete len:1289 (+),score=254.09 GEMP01002756.1:46-3912(+)